MTPRPPRGIDDAAAAFGYRHTPTLRVSTAKGCHDYYWAPGSLRLGNGLGALRGKLDGDVRAGNAYVIGPGSVHATGVVYELADADQPPTPAPSWLLTALLAPTPQPALSSRPTPSGRGRGGGGLLGLIRFVLESREGQRNERLFWAACRAFEIAQGKRLDARAAADALTDAAVRVGLPDAEARKTITSAYRARQPVTGNTSDQAREILEQTGLSEEAKRRTLRITGASGIEPEPVVWAWTDEGEGRIPAGALTVAAGREGTGKSSFGMWMAAHVTRGTLPGSFEGQPRAVFYVAIEDSWKQTIVPRLITAGANLELVCRVEAVEAEYGETTLSLPQDNSLTEGAIGGHGVALVVLDPLMSCIGKGIDTHRERDVRTALDPLACMAGRTGAVLLGIAHFNKGSGTDPAALITGSGAFKNVPRAVFGFARDDDHDCRVMTQAKNSLGRIDLPSLSYTVTSAEVPTRLGIANVGRFTFTGRSARTVDEILAAGAQTDRGERDEAAEWLRGYLIDHGGQASGKDVKAAAAADDISARTLQRAMRKAGVTAERSGFGKGTTWCLDTPEPTTHGEQTQASAPQSRHSRQGSKPGANGANDGADGAHTGPESQNVIDDRPPCASCGLPMKLIEPGQTNHPACDPPPSPAAACAACGNPNGSADASPYCDGCIPAEGVSADAR